MKRERHLGAADSRKEAKAPSRKSKLVGANIAKMAVEADYKQSLTVVVFAIRAQ